ncbi:SAVMC3_10250 family protein [Streptomyces sp. NPDC056296]|uniref:SAVMC3_10250 family protein n=1 Tax=Streptomyces sp. NPDC056296 TaxID=3345775 RepID=UPI0035DFFDF7
MQGSRNDFAKWWVKPWQGVARCTYIIIRGAGMREFLYLSDGKLRQFLPEPRRFRRPSAIRLNTPVGGVDVETQAATDDRARLMHLRQVDKHLDKRALWFTEPDLCQGQWVWFEAPLRCVTLRGEYQHMVLFVDPASGEEPEYEQETDCRLLLHGSAHHLMGYVPVAIDGPPLEGITGGSSIATTFMTSAGHVVRSLSLEHDSTELGLPAPDIDLSGDAVRSLIAALDVQSTATGRAGRMCGYARITADLPATNAAERCIVASPLAVEYAYSQA